MDALTSTIQGANNSAPGSGDTQKIMLKHLTLKDRTLFSICITKFDTMKTSLKSCNFHINPKPKCHGKDPTSPSIYRLIELTIVLCKTMERMINERLLDHHE